MDGSSFDRITRRLAVTTSRRRGIAALVAGALGVAGVSRSDAVLNIPPRCRNAGSACQTGDVCCSGRCITKADGSMRCARTTSNRKQKDQCTKKGKECQRDADCCRDLTC